MCKLASILVFAIAGNPAILHEPSTAAQVQGTGKDTPKIKIDQPKRTPDSAQVKQQIDKARQYYQEVLEVNTTPIHETAHFLIVGQYPKRSAELIGGDLEQTYAKSCKALELPPDPGPWPGKLVVFLLAEPKSYGKMVRLAQRRKADEDESSSHSTGSTLKHVVVCPGKGPGDLGVSGMASVQMGAMLCIMKADTKLPDWLSEGFGRAATLNAGPATALGTERRKAAIFLAQNKRSANDIINDTLRPDETPVLRFSLLDYLVFSGRTSKFLPLLQGFPPNGNLDEAFKKATLSRDDLSSNWLKYAGSFK